MRYASKANGYRSTANLNADCNSCGIVDFTTFAATMPTRITAASSTMPAAFTLADDYEATINVAATDGITGSFIGSTKAVSATKEAVRRTERLL